MGPTLRVAAAQFATGTDVSANLATTLRMIDEAAAEDAELVVLPEFCNHLSVYDDGDHAWRVAVDLDGPWIADVGARAAQHRMWIQVNCTVRRPGDSTAREAVPGRITNTNLVFSPAGRLVATNDKTVLMGAEGDYLSPADRASTLVEIGDTIVGTYACMDGVVPEVPRAVALRGATLLLNSLNSFALDEASLHIPVRAAENKAWVVACCKVGPLLPADKVAMFSDAMGVPPEYLDGAGESQIVDPTGRVVAQAPRRGEAVIVAEIDLRWAGDKQRPDGTDVFASRRPEVYAALGRATPPLDEHPRAESIEVAVAASAVAARSLTGDRQLLVLPPLVDATVDELAALAGDGVVVTSRREGGAHVGIVVGRDGIVGRQVQVHAVRRHRDWQHELGDAVSPIDLPWGRLGVIVGEDLIYPEVARLLALASCDVVAVPCDPDEEWERRLGLVERAAENRMCLAAACRIGDSLVVDLPPDFTLWAPSRHRVFDGTINFPDVVQRSSDDGPITATLHPARAVNRQISKGTNLVDGRPWRLAGALVEPLI